MVAPGIGLHSMFCLQIEYKVPWLNHNRNLIICWYDMIKNAIEFISYMSFLHNSTYMSSSGETQFKQGCKDQESIQLSTIPYPGYQWESAQLTVKHHKRALSQQVTTRHI